MAYALSCDEIVCSICLDQYKDPRTLPCCDHSFCALCILKHFKGIETGIHKSETGQDEIRLECPVCRSTIVPPSDDFRVTEKWIQALPKDTGILSKIERNRTTSVTDDSNDDENESESICDICKELGKSSNSVSVCMECQEKLCETCQNIHRVSKLSKNHTVLDIENTLEGGDYSNNFFKLLSKYTHCTEHEGKLIEFYCKEDKLLLCLVCYLSHIKYCKNILEIEQICDKKDDYRRNVVNLKGDTLSLSRFAKQINHTLQTIKGNQEKESTDMSARLQNIRTTVNKLIDSLEDSIQSQHRAILKQSQFQGSEFKDKFSETKDKLDMNITVIEKL